MFALEKRKRGNWGLKDPNMPEYATLELTRHARWAVIIRTNDYWAEPIDRAYGFTSRIAAEAYARQWLLNRYRDARLRGLAP
jgi:hypothetical protein